MELSEHTVVIAKVVYADGTGSKVRPAFVIALDDKVIKTYRITSQYENKSEYIKSKYFEIIDYIEAGLRKRSWIDTVQAYNIDSDKTKIRVLGYLSARDEVRLQEFLEQIE
ncbi:hypothetical protein [Lactococcus protaetiae]|uniref:Uncharacterized protein n=1 Tax=Lactococcus protaetiae TaxID=2592653 RepID=A0A514Z6C6_9LACT|nr:hypothetical protein [Lactococcus protaetiae]QDK70140.1 hypothetical protein FLP15_01800 [Lactococcus protaetiae]